MKKIIFSASFIILLFVCFSSYAQPGNPSKCNTGVWNLSANASTINNGTQVTIYANYLGAGCPAAGTININLSSTYVSASPTSPVSVFIPVCSSDPDSQCQTNGQIVVGTFTLTHSQTSASTITFQIGSITGGHSTSGSVVVTVNP